VSDDTATITFVAIIWMAVGLAVSLADGTYTTIGVALVSLAWIALLIMLFRPRIGEGARSILLFAGFVSFAVAAVYPAGLYGKGPWLETSRVFVLIATAAMALLIPLRLRRATQRVVFGCLAMFSATASISMIRASARPRIDVWYMYQAASRGILHGANPYGLHWTSGIPGEVSNGFSYLPGSALLLAPFNWAFGDVRYGLVAATLVAACGIFWLAKGDYAWLLGAFVLLFPKFTFGIEQGWNDPVLLALVVVFVCLVVSARTRPANVVLTVVFACIQYGVFFIPLAARWAKHGWKRTALAAIGSSAITLPWMIPEWRAAWHSVVVYPLRLPARPDSLSLYTLALVHGWRPSTMVLGLLTGLALLVCLYALEPTAWGFCGSSAFVLATFVLWNKQVFFNDWQLVAMLVVLTGAAGTRCNLQSSRRGSRDLEGGASIGAPRAGTVEGGDREGNRPVELPDL
jgi:hypothetical protein